MIIFSKALADQATVWEALRASESCQNLPAESAPVSQPDKTGSDVEFDTSCNLACQHCYMDAILARDEMTLEEGIHLVDDLAELEIPILIFTGGEPLLSRNFYALAFSRPRGGPAHSNLHQWNPDNSEVARLLAEAGIRYVGVSLDSALPERHDEFRGVTGAYARALQGLKNARDAGLKNGLANNPDLRQLAGCPGYAQPGSGGEYS